MKRILIALLVVVFGTSAFAMEIETSKGKVDLYTSIRAFGYYEDAQANDSGTRDYSQFKLGLQGNSRFGMKWSMGDVFAHFEAGSGGNDVGTPGVNLRLFYGGYKIDGGNAGTIKFGQLSSISNTNGYSNRKLNADDALTAFGTVMESRRQGINYEISGLSVSLLTMKQDSSDITAAYTSKGYTNVDFIELVPRIEAAYTFPFPLKVMGSYAMVNITADNESRGEVDKDDDLSAYHVALALYPKIGDNMYLNLTGFYGVNVGLYNMVFTASGVNKNTGYGKSRVMPVYNTANNDFEDTTSFGGTVAFGVKFDPKATMEIGLGYQASSNDLWVDDMTGMGAYVNLAYKVAPQFTITPEIGYYDCGKIQQLKTATKTDDDKNSTVIQAGVQLRLDI